MTQRRKGPKKQYSRIVLSVEINTTSTVAIESIKKMLIMVGEALSGLHNGFKNRMVKCSVEENTITG